MISFIEKQKAAALSPASLRRRAAALRGFCRWLLSQGLLVADPWNGASLALGRSRRLPRILAAHELDRLIEFLARAAHSTPADRPTAGQSKRDPMRRQLFSRSR